MKGKIVKIDTPEMLKAVAEEESIIEISFEKTVPKILEKLSERLPQLKMLATGRNTVRIYGDVPTHIARAH